MPIDRTPPDNQPRRTIPPITHPPKRPATPFILAALGIVVAIAAYGLHMNGYPDEAPYAAAIGLVLLAAGTYGIWKEREE